MTIRKTTDLFVVDGDVHANESPALLAPYCEMPWRLSLEASAKQDTGYFSVPGFSPALSLDPFFPGDFNVRRTGTLQKMRKELDELGMDMGILWPNHMLYVGSFPNPDYATALCRAYNRWIADCWLGRSEGLKALLVVPPQNIEAGVEEIQQMGNHPDIVGICLVTACVTPLYGNRKYDPLYKAAQAANLPIALHSVEVVYPTFPFNLECFETTVARHAIAHPFSMMANLISLINTGVPERFPELKIGFFESGISWVPFMMYRLDREYLAKRFEVPFLKKPPSEYIKNFFYGTQPIEDPESLSQLVDIFKLFDGENNTLYASDWPHFDFDNPQKLLQIPFSDEAKRKIMGENALRFFRMDRVERSNKADRVRDLSALGEEIQRYSTTPEAALALAGRMQNGED